VEKKTLLKVLQNYSAQSETEAKEVISLTSEYPFCQSFQVLSAKISKDFEFPGYQSELQKAAIIVSDRSLLKEIMLAESVAVPISVAVAPPNEQRVVVEKSLTPEAQKPVKVETEPQSERKLVVYHDIEKTIDTIDMADMVIKDLKRLNELKHNFEMLYADQSAVSIPVLVGKTFAPEPSEEPKVEENTVDEAVSGKSRRAKIIALARSLNGGPEITEPTSKRKRKENQSDLIEELKITKEEIEPESERQKEQIQIIDHFIKTQPSINATVRERNPMPPADLNSTKSGEFGESIVSETLVEILIKQGKKDRAIEVLKKLIWKYPQKKAYFATRIEDLKK
jgi:hypothetical protein